MWYFIWFVLMFANLEAEEVYYHTFDERILTNEELLQQANENTTFWCSVGIEQPCDPNEGRRIDGSCNNLQHPTIGASHTPFVRVLPLEFEYDVYSKPAQSGESKPLCRHIRTTLLAAGSRPDSTFTQLATHFFVFVAADVVSIQDTLNYVIWTPHCCLPKGKTDPMCAPIKVPSDDPVHRFSGVSCLNGTKPMTYQTNGCLRNGTTPERINSALPLFDLSIIYGNNNKNAKKGRLYSGGLLKYELDNGRIYPPSSGKVCVLNEQPRETKCYSTPEDAGTNSIIGINLLSIWFWRNHNKIASTLADLNPSWRDGKLFETARDINIAILVQIFYNEFLPLLMGSENLRSDSVISEHRGFRDRYDPKVLPQISLEFPYILRWAHLMQEGKLKMYDESGNYMKQIPIVNLTLRTGYLANDNNLDYITQGSFRQASGKLDYIIDPEMSEQVLGKMLHVSDVASSDLQKGRLMGFAPYVKYVEHCSGKNINSFEDLAEFMDDDNIELLQALYPDVRKIELLAGTWMEKRMNGSFVPPTFYCIVVDQLIRSMVSDRHWYERPNRPNAFTSEQLHEIRKASISQLLCDVADTVTRIQPRGFERVGPKNKMISCDEITRIDLTAWRDDSCAF